MEDQVIDLQIKISHQEQLLEQLNEALIFQQKQIDRLQSELKSLTDSGKSSNSLVKSLSEEVPPPHY